MGSVQVVTIYHCCTRAEEDEVELDGEHKENLISNQLPVIKKRKHEKTNSNSKNNFATTGLKKYMVLTLSCLDSISTKPISMQKELSKLKYLLELKKAD